MTETGKILDKVLWRWKWYKFIQLIIPVLGISCLVYFLFLNINIALITFIISLSVGVWFFKPWKVDLKDVANQFDGQFSALENSTGLLLQNPLELTLLGQIQQLKTAERLKEYWTKIKLKNNIIPAVIFGVCCFMIGWLLRYSGVLSQKTFENSNVTDEKTMILQPLDTMVKLNIAPKITNQKVIINPPKYTNMSSVVGAKMQMKVLEGSTISWRVTFDQVLNGVQLQLGDKNLPLQFKKGSYLKTISARESNFYSFKFLDTLNNAYISEVYAVEVYKDVAPEIKFIGLDQFSSFTYGDKQVLDFKTNVQDDFGIDSVSIIATVSKGSGESVKFREERLAFDNQYKKHAKNAVLNKKIDLVKLGMDPGDELYFYVEASDNKEPKPNKTRSETFFAVIEDTVTDVFAVEGSLGADLMPDYFRSQRQLIIDTEKLISEKSTIKLQEFNFRSNELGFDQKALRLKYGKFMGDESEGPMATTSNSLEEDENNLLEGYTHDHDSENEHNLVAEEEHGHDHEGETSEESDENPLEAYVHNHEDPEASTLFAKSLKSKLKQAMAEMWDAELYLRLYEPHKSLPYQYKALKLIQEIKNSARIYVHRIGFDPPPIKEDKRLSGDIETITNFTKKENLKIEEANPNIHKAIAILEMALSNKKKLEKQNMPIFEKAGSELAVLAIAEPSLYLNTLQGLKRLSQTIDIEKETQVEVLNGLYRIVPDEDMIPTLLNSYNNQLNDLFLEALDEVNE
jgi:hypothetical protein